MSSRNKTSGKGYGKSIRALNECLQHVMQNINDLMQSGLTLFFYDNASSDIGGYLQLNTGVPVTAAADVVLSPTADNEEMEQWASESALGVEFIFAGQMDIHFHAHKTVQGTHDTGIYFKVYHRTTGAAETLIGTSNHSSYLTTTSAAYSVMIHIADTVIAVTDRIVVKAFAHLSGSGGDPVIHFEVEGTGASAKMTHVSLPGISANDALELHKANTDVHKGGTTRHFVMLYPESASTAGAGNVYWYRNLGAEIRFGNTSLGTKFLGINFQVPANYEENTDILLKFYAKPLVGSVALVVSQIYISSFASGEGPNWQVAALTTALSPTVLGTADKLYLLTLTLPDASLNFAPEDIVVIAFSMDDNAAARTIATLAWEMEYTAS